MERFAPGHHGYPHTSDLIRVKALKGRMCHQITDVSVRPFLHLLNLTRRPWQEAQHPVVGVSDPLSIFWVDHTRVNYAAAGKMRVS